MELYGIVILQDNKIIDWTISKYKISIRGTQSEVVEHNKQSDDKWTMDYLEGNDYTEFQLWFRNWEIHPECEENRPYPKNSYILTDENINKNMH